MSQVSKFYFQPLAVLIVMMCPPHMVIILSQAGSSSVSAVNTTLSVNLWLGMKLLVTAELNTQNWLLPKTWMKWTNLKRKFHLLVTSLQSGLICTHIHYKNYYREDNFIKEDQKIEMAPFFVRFFCRSISLNGVRWNNNCSVEYPFICYNGEHAQKESCYCHKVILVLNSM